MPSLGADGLLVNTLLTHEKKLKNDEEEASDALLEIHERMAKLQAEMAAAAGRLSRIRKIRSRVSSKRSEAVRRGLQGLDEEDELLGALDGHERCLVQDMQVMGVPNDIDWSSLGLGEEFENATPLVLDSSLSSGVVHETPSADAARG